MVLAMGGEMGKGHDIGQKPDDWPKGLESALASQEHEGGYWVNANDCYWFSGNTDALNRFLTESAKIEGAPVNIRFHSGKGEGKSFGKKPSIPIDWQVSSFCRNWSDEWPKGSPTEYMVRIDIWDGGQVDRKAVVIPTGIIVQPEKATTQPTSRPAGNTPSYHSRVIKLIPTDIPYSAQFTMSDKDAIRCQLPGGKVVALWCHKDSEAGEQTTASGLKTVWGERPVTRSRSKS